MGLGGLAVIAGASDDSDCLPESRECLGDADSDEEELPTRVALLGGGSAAVALGAALMKYRPAKSPSLRTTVRARRPAPSSKPSTPSAQLVDPALRKIVEGADPPPVHDLTVRPASTSLDGRVSN